MSLRRIRALVFRYTVLYTRSVPRILEMIFWPVMDLLVWGFLTAYLRPQLSTVTFLLGAMIFWDIIYRSAQGVTMSFLEDVWTRNLLNVFVAPLRVGEFIAASFLVGFLKITFIVIILSVMALGLYQFNLLSMGLALIPFFANLLLMGWAIGMVTTALILRWGQAAEGLAWGIPFAVQPLAAVFYPVSILPAWAQPFSLAIPATHVFEGMRQVLLDGTVSAEHLAAAFGLNLVWLAAAAFFFRHMFNAAREKGLLVKLATQ